MPYCERNRWSMPLSDLTQARLKEVLSYSPETGEFKWLVFIKGNRGAGTTAGSRRADGYVTIKLDYGRYLAHRLAWFYMTGKWPKEEVDHIDRNPSNNSFSNLREATKSQNMANSIGKTKISKSGLKGVLWCEKDNRWYARIKHIHLGSFICPAAAHLTYIVAAHKQYGQYSRSI